MSYNAADRKQVRQQEKAARLEESQRREIIKGIMSLAAGRQWMLERLESCHVFASSYTGNALATAFAEGERNVGLQLLDDVMRSVPDLYVTMMQERNARDAYRDTARKRPDSPDANGGDQGRGAASDDDPDSGDDDYADAGASNGRAVEDRDEAD